ncbi:MAG: D-alanine--D-alanine ligase [Flavobacteriales bacterium]|nr:D-alanine--D-alanine ligase [Flavobacteriales bacterium]
MRPIIAVLAGGFSGEYEVSIKSAGTIMDHLDQARFESYLVVMSEEGSVAKTSAGDQPLDLNTFSFDLGGQKKQFDYAYIIIHGTPGEDGKVQGYLDMMRIPYNTGSLLNMALTFNKAHTQVLMKLHDIPVADHIIFRADDRPDAQQVVDRLGLPCFVKPTESGSSIGVTKVKTIDALEAAIDTALAIHPEVIIESLLTGKELACGVFRDEGAIRALPVIEIRSTREFFDYTAKYDDAETEEIVPAPIPEAAFKKCQELSKRIYDITDCRGIARADFFLCEDGLYFVEINTIPGMSPESLIPKELRAEGLDLTELLSRMIINDMEQFQKK